MVPPTHSLMVPHVYIGTRPSASSTVACTAIRAAAISRNVDVGRRRARAVKASAQEGKCSVMRLLPRGVTAAAPQAFKVSIVTLRLV